MGPGLRPARKQRVYMLYLSPTIAAFAGEIQPDERERRAYRARLGYDVLRAVGVHLQLVNERALSISTRQGIGVQLTIEPPARGGGVVAPVAIVLYNWQAHSATGTITIEWRRHTIDRPFLDTTRIRRLEQA